MIHDGVMQEDPAAGVIHDAGFQRVVVNTVKQHIAQAREENI